MFKIKYLSYMIIYIIFKLIISQNKVYFIINKTQSVRKIVIHVQQILVADILKYLGYASLSICKSERDTVLLYHF